MIEFLTFAVPAYIFCGFVNVAFSESSNYWYHKLLAWPVYFYSYVKSKLD